MKKVKLHLLISLVTIALIATLGVVVWRGRSPQPNVVLISIDTLRADHLGCYGYKRLTSPAIDTLASEGVRFSKAYSPTSWTLPGHMSIITSLYPHVHGVEMDRHRLAEKKITLAEKLSEAGYHTTAFVSWFYLSKRFGFGQGFDEFTELLPSEEHFDMSTKLSYKAEEVTDAVLGWLRKKPSKPFFLFVHYFDPHMNYEPPAPYDRMFDPDYEGKAKGTYQWLKTYIQGLYLDIRKIEPRDLQYITALYDGEIRYTDTHLARLLEAIEQTVGIDNCIVILTSDHGEELNDHGSMEGHQWTLYNEVVHVPLIFRFPGKVCAGISVDIGVSLIDIAPTILDWLGITSPTEFQGQSLMGLINGQHKGQPEQMIFAETWRYTIKQSIRTEQYKLIHTDNIWINKGRLPLVGEYEMYDMNKDPLEQNNIYDSTLTIAKQLAQKLQFWRNTRVETDTGGKKEAVVEFRPEEIERLRALGYIQ